MILKALKSERIFSSEYLPFAFILHLLYESDAVSGLLTINQFNKSFIYFICLPNDENWANFYDLLSFDGCFLIAIMIIFWVFL